MSTLAIPTFVINLARATERRRHMESSLRPLGIAAEFVAGVDGENLTRADWRAYDARRCLRLYGVAMMPSELGCNLSHYRLYQRMLCDRIDAALIMEDDLHIDPALPRVINELLDLAGIDWSVIRLETLRGQLADPERLQRHGHRVASLSGGFGLYRLRTHVLGAAAYLINRRGAASMVEYGRQVFMPIDHTMDRFWENGIVPYVVSPFPVRQIAELPSVIGSRPSNRHRDQPPRIRIARSMQRVSDSVRKRLFNLLH